MKVADIILPYHNSLHHLRPCLESVFQRTPKDSFHLYLGDDVSDEYTKGQVGEILAKYDAEQYTLLESRARLGYLRNVNRGILAGNNPYVVLLNSDTIVTTGWLEGLLSCFDRDEKIAIVNPLSNWANWTRIDLAPGYDIEEFAALIRTLAKGRIKDIYNASGFCFAVRRPVFEDLGVFDDIYDIGYWEEADFCMKALSRNHRVAVDLSTFIYHYGWGSHGSGHYNQMMERNRVIFLSRWRELFAQAEAAWKNERPVYAFADEVTRQLAGKEYVPPLIPGKIGRALRYYGFSISARAATSIALNRLLHAHWEANPMTLLNRRLVKQHTAKVARFARRGYEPPKAAPAPSAPSGKSRDFRVLYLLPKFDLYGGVISVVQIVNQLIQLGARANIVTYSEPNENFLRGMPLYFTPYFRPFRRAAWRDFPECDLLVATSWDAVYDSLEIQKRRPQVKLTYFVQDYEPEFYPPGSSEARQAELTYSLIGPKIAKTDWLIRRLQRFPGEVTKIPLGLDLDIFYDRKDPARQETVRIAAMVRPNSDYRNFPGAIKILKEVKQRRPEVVISLYGAELETETLPFECEIAGLLNQREGVAELLNRSTVLLDCSIFQGFGRPGLEAMACGAATVLTREGGITEYAKHQYNCLLADPRDVEDNVNKILQLVDDEKLRARLVAEGLNTARKFDSRLEGERTLACFRRLMSD